MGIWDMGCLNASGPILSLRKVLLNGLNPDRHLGFMDNIMIVGHTWNQFIEDLDKLLGWIEEANLKGNPKKPKFGHNCGMAGLSL
jgi:hypothetical protein